MVDVIWIGFTTTYREGGPQFERAASTLAAEKSGQFPRLEVLSECVNTKRDFVDALKRIATRGQQIQELHFVGHSGMYGIMFRSSAMPEQFSPHEWRSLSIPFAVGARAYFHACRTARWFAPFFARTFNVVAYGYHWYTTISTSSTRFRWAGPFTSPTQPLYVLACPGRKSHGLLGASAKYAGLVKPELMKQFEPEPVQGDPSYQGVARLYAAAFADIGVREAELRWLREHAPRRTRVLDLGCGSGSLLKQLAPDLRSGVGVDSSSAMLSEARMRCSGFPQLTFEQLTGPVLPFPDQSFDVVISLLSFRYLDWDPIINEIRRVLRPGGRLLVVDMVTVPVRATELPRLIGDKWRSLRGARNNRNYRFALRELVKHKSWATMLKHNPIRSEHEFRWYLESRFPPHKVSVLNLAWSTRVLAFDSGPLQPGTSPAQSYP